MKKQALTASALLTLILSLSACSPATTPKDSPIASKPAPSTTLTQCPSPRPQACTRQYQPVCGVAAGGKRDTYSNSCTACSNKEIQSYAEKACP